MARVKAEDAVQLNVRLAPADVEALEELVRKNQFLSISDAVRTAVRMLIAKYKEVDK